jgi:hypothetical protein
MESSTRQVGHRMPGAMPGADSAGRIRRGRGRRGLAHGKRPRRAAQQRLRIQSLALSPLMLVHQNAAQLRELVRWIVERGQNDRAFVDLLGQAASPRRARPVRAGRRACRRRSLERCPRAPQPTRQTRVRQRASPERVSGSAAPRVSAAPGAPAVSRAWQAAVGRPTLLPRPQAPPPAALPTPKTDRDRPSLIVHRFPPMPHHTSKLVQPGHDRIMRLCRSNRSERRRRTRVRAAPRKNGLRG